MTTYKIDKYEIIFLSAIQRTAYIIHTRDNNCPGIRVGDRVELDEIDGDVESIEWFMKSFGIKGDNVTILIKTTE